MTAPQTPAAAETSIDFQNTRALGVSRGANKMYGMIIHDPCCTILENYLRNIEGQNGKTDIECVMLIEYHRLSSIVLSGNCNRSVNNMHA